MLANARGSTAGGRVRYASPSLSATMRGEIMPAAYNPSAKYEVKIWDGTKFGPDDPGKYPGEQRLKLTFSIKPGASKAWLHYYAETIGVLELPR